MRRIFTYILALLALSVACQRVDLPENQPAELPLGAIGSKATITFSTAELLEPETRGVVDPNVKVNTLHLIVFDANGMLVEVCEAKELSISDAGVGHYTVTLTVTDEPRIIHYVANCPVDQVVYGHETSIIGNMYVDRNFSEGATTEHETSYWARIEVPYILVEEKKEDGKIIVSLVDAIKGKFEHVPLLRNYAEITVTDMTGDTFLFEGFTVYNLLDRGTVAPYNSTKQEFQSFTYTDPETGKIKNYLYPKISSFGYEGHALTSANLITDFIRYDETDATPGVEGKEVGDIKIYESNAPFYVYERKVSVMTDEEEKWRESPPHIIIKGKYNGGKAVEDDSPTYYYKMDLVYTEKDAQGKEEIKYYNILRNFMYQFNITAVHDVGYKTLDEAVAGAAGNNISGSSSTSKLTNISDNKGRLWVSHTDTTLVASKDIVLRYKYIPNYYDSTKPDYNKVDNDQARFENIVGEVITGIVVADEDIEGGTWDGYRKVTISVKEPSKITRQQILSLKTNSAHLNRQIRYTLREKLTMQVEATPKVLGKIMEKVTVDIKLPIGMTEDMFPLKLDMETLNRTLSPDATKNSIPVTAGPSIIEDRNGALSYYYTVTIPTFEAYKALPNDGNMKVVTTYWLTNMAANASTFYVANKYFNQAYDSWQNYKYEFSNATCTPSPVGVGVGEAVTISFNMDSGDNAYNSRPVNISLKGMTYNGATELSWTPGSRDVRIECKTTTATDRVSFTLDAGEYNIVGPVVGERKTYTFNGAFAAASLKTEADVEVDFTFNISDEAFEALKKLYPDAVNAGVGVPMYVTLDRLHPADDQLIYSQAKAGGDRYIYRIKNAGKQTIKLATTDAAVGDCTVTLQADYFDTQSVTIRQKGKEFRSLTIPDKVSGGTGQSVNITFQLAAGDSNRDVTVVLENMARNGETILTFNTGNSNIVTNSNGTFTINNVVTTGAADATLKVKISALGYEDKEVTCSDRPPLEGTISFANTNQRISRNNSQQVWQNAGITLTNDRNEGQNVSDRTNPVRFYSGQKLTIGAEGNIKSITFVCYNSTYATYATNLKNSIGTVSGATVTTSGSNVTVTFTNATTTQFVINLTAEVRMNSLTVAYYKQQ